MHRRASLLALAISLTAAGLLLWMIGHGGFGATRSVVVVTRDIAVGEAIARPALDFRDLPESFLEERHVPAEDVDRLIGMRTLNAVGSGAALLWSDLEASRPGRTLSALVQVGMRALSLAQPSFEGQPGDRADVLFVPRIPDDGTPDEQPTVALLENALVLTVSPERVTLSVSPRDAQRIAHTEGRGIVKLALRNPHDVAMADAFDDARGAP
jgi:pilus assembly protein CpaB